jgi:hypothetical protein
MNNRNINKGKMTRIIIAIILIGVCAANAAFENNDISGRVVGLGNAYTAVSDEAAGMYYNPGGVSYIESRSIMGSYTKPYLGVGSLGNGYIGVGLPVKDFLSMGIYINYFGDEIYTERVLGFVVGYKYKMAEKQSLAVGVSAKNMSKSVGTNEFIEGNSIFDNKRSVSALGFDAGALYRMTDAFSAGVSVLNINEPDVSFQDADKVPMKIKGGVAVNVMKELLVAADVDYLAAGIEVDAGAEYKVGKTGVLARIGGAWSSQGNNSVSLGVGYEYEPKGFGIIMDIDYGFRYPFGFIDGDLGTHVMSITIKETVKKAEDLK